MSFRKTLELNPTDDICRMYIERCELLKVNPPVDAWDGVWIMDSK